MRGITELMQKILTSDEGKTIIDYVSPIYSNSYVGLWLLQVIGIELDVMRKWVNETRMQALPQTATWGLEYWEDEHEIIPDANATYESRQRQILAKLNLRAPANPYRLSQIVSSITGCKCEIKERTGKNKFTVIIYEDADPTNLNKLYTAIENAKPAHLTWSVEFDERVYGKLGIAAISKLGITLTLYPWQIHNYENIGTVQTAAAMKSCLSVTVLERG